MFIIRGQEGFNLEHDSDLPGHCCMLTGSSPSSPSIICLVTSTCSCKDMFKLNLNYTDDGTFFSTRKNVLQFWLCHIRKMVQFYVKPHMPSHTVRWYMSQDIKLDLIWSWADINRNCNIFFEWLLIFAFCNLINLKVFIYMSRVFLFFFFAGIDFQWCSFILTC